jgi:hypothetical protein
MNAMLFFPGKIRTAKSWVPLLIAGLCLVLPGRMDAGPSVSLVPTTQTIAAGGTADVDLMISGLGNHTHPALGAWSVTVDFNPSIANLSSVVFGSHLTPSFQDINTTIPGQVQLSEVSFALPEELIPLQLDSFLLAELGFTGLTSGALNVNVSYLDLSDENGHTLGVPETGSTLTLLALASVGLRGGRWMGRRARSDAASG